MTTKRFDQLTMTGIVLGLGIVMCTLVYLISAHFGEHVWPGVIACALLHVGNAMLTWYRVGKRS